MDGMQLKAKHYEALFKKIKESEGLSGKFVDKVYWANPAKIVVTFSGHGNGLKKSYTLGTDESWLEI